MTRRFFITEAVYEKILGTLRNEYDILLGKSFTVEPRASSFVISFDSMIKR